MISYRSQTVSHVQVKWEIENFYSVFEESNVIQSPAFEQSGVSFCLRMYPYSYNHASENEEWVSMNLVRISPLDEEQTFAYSFKQDNHSAIPLADGKNVFRNDRNEHGSQRFVERLRLLQYQDHYAPGNVFSIICDIKSPDDPNYEPPEINRSKY